jgi:hypothetical protein
MYDLAHKKGAVHVESKAAARKSKDKAKARESRNSIRKKNWEKRHLSREILRKQDKKNREKRERKEAKQATKAREREEKEPKDKAIQTEDLKEIEIKKADKSIQTNNPTKMVDPLAAALPINDTNKGGQNYFESVSSISSSGTPETPSSGASSSALPTTRICTPPPPPPYRNERKYSSSRNIARKQYYTSDGESSASPISGKSISHSRLS